MLAGASAEAAACEPSGVVRLVPMFDQYTVGASLHADALLPAPELRARVYRPQGWLTAVVLVDGRMEGVWRFERRGRRLPVEVEPFRKLSRPLRSAVEAEAERIAAFLGGDAGADVGQLGELLLRRAEPLLLDALALGPRAGDQRVEVDALQARIAALRVLQRHPQEELALYAQRQRLGGRAAAPPGLSRSAFSAPHAIAWRTSSRSTASRRITSISVSRSSSISSASGRRGGGGQAPGPRPSRPGGR